MRPNFIHVGGVFYWTITTKNPDTQVLKDADSNPTVAVRKNGSAVGDSVTVNKRSATVGIYDCSYNPAGDVEGDVFQFEESATVTGTTTSSATYNFSWSARVVAVERGTDGALTSLGANAPANWIVASSIATDARTAIATAVEAAILNDADGQQFLAAMQSTVQGLFDNGVDVPIVTIVNGVRDAILNRVLAGNHETAGTVGKILQLLNSLSGITSLADWLRRIARKDAGTAGMISAQGEINTGGSATFNGPDDSLESIKDSSGGGGGGSGDTSSFSGSALAMIEAIQQTAANVIIASGIKLGAAGMPGQLRKGDARSVSTNTALIIRIYDVDNPLTPLTQIGTQPLSTALLTLSFKRPGATSADAQINCSFHTSGADAWVRATWDKTGLDGCEPDLSVQYNWALKAEWGSVGSRVDPLTIASGRVFIVSEISPNH